MSNLDSSISDFTFKRNDMISENNSDNISDIVYEQNGGGILNSLFGTNEMDKLLLDSFSDGRPDVACYLLCKIKKCPQNICKTDETGRNLLHHMTIFASHGNMVIHIGKIFRSCGKTKLKKALNTQDKLGNTPIHYATNLGFNNLVKLYIDNGANITIRNNKGEYVAEDNASDRKSQNTTVDVSIIIPSPHSDERIINEENPLIIPEFSNTDSLNTIHFINEIEKELVKKHNNKALVKDLDKDLDNNAVIISNTTDSDTILTEQIIEEILNKTKKIEPNAIKLDINKDLSDNMVGGAKKKSKKQKKNKKLGRLISGERKIITYSEISKSDKNYSDIFVKSDKSYKSEKNTKSEEYTITLKEAVNSDDSNISDIARQLNRQSSDIHERAVLKIIELLKLDKNNENDIQKARNYKAAIYRTVKEKNPLLNNFDRAVEMEKSITLETLKSINIEKVTKEIEKHLSEKSASTNTTTNTSTNTSTSASSKSEKSESKSVSTSDKPIKKAKETKEVKETKKTKPTKLAKSKTESSLSLDSDSKSIEFSSISQF